MKTEELKKINTTVLAYMGDAVYEQAVREHLLRTGISDVNKMHRMATGYVRASSQAAVVRHIFDRLTEQEQALVKRARNRKTATKSRNADPITYKWATAFEALVGYLYLAEDTPRLEWLLENAMELAERQDSRKDEGAGSV